MDGYDAIIEEIRSCGREAVAAGGATKQVDLPEAMSGVEPALPGSASAVAAGTLRTVWATRLRTLGGDVVQLGTDLGAAADEYARNESAAQVNLETIDPRYERYR